MALKFNIESKIVLESKLRHELDLHSKSWQSREKANAIDSKLESKNTFLSLFICHKYRK